MHKTRRTRFHVCVDDFGVKYFNKKNAYHRLQDFKNNYDYTIYRTGAIFCGPTFKWDYKEGFVGIFMTDYIPNVLKQFLHKPPIKPH